MFRKDNLEELQVTTITPYPHIRGIQMITSCNSDTLGYKVFDCQVQNSKNNKVNQFLTLLKEPEIQSFLKSFVDSAIATSELRILKRIAAVEQILGLEDYGADETAAPTLPQRIKILEDKVNSITSFKPFKEPEIQPTTKTEKRAVSLVDHLRKTEKDHLTSREITNFLKCKLPDSCKLDKNIQNIRKVKQDVLKKAAAMYSNVFLSKKSTGHHEVRLVLGS